GCVTTQMNNWSRPGAQPSAHRRARPGQCPWGSIAADGSTIANGVAERTGVSQLLRSYLQNLVESRKRTMNVRVMLFLSHLALVLTWIVVLWGTRSTGFLWWVWTGMVLCTLTVAGMDVLYFRRR